MEERFRKLERRNRPLAIGLALALLPWVVAASDKSPELINGKKGKFDLIEAQKIVLVDDAGKQVGILSGQKKGSNFAVLNGNGKTRLLLGISEGNPSLLFADKDGDPVASYRELNGAFEIKH